MTVRETLHQKTLSIKGLLILSGMTLQELADTSKGCPQMHERGIAGVASEAHPASKNGSWTCVDHICQVVCLHGERDQAIEGLGDREAKPEWP